MDETIREDGETTEPSLLDQLPETLGFVETSEIKEARAGLIQTIATDDWPRIHALKRRYLELGQAVAEQAQGEDFAKAQIGLIVATALMWRDADRPKNYGGELYNAHQYAFNMRFDDVAAVLEKAMVEAGQEINERLPYETNNLPEALSKEYLEGLKELAAKFEAESQPVQVEMSGNTLIVNGKLLEAANGAATLWRALKDGRDMIMQGLEKHRAHMHASDPAYEIAPVTPFKVVRLGDKPEDVLSASGMERTNHFERVFLDIADIKEEFHPYWQAVEVSGFIPDVRLYAHRSGWYPLNLWAQEPKKFPENEFLKTE